MSNQESLSSKLAAAMEEWQKATDPAVAAARVAQLEAAVEKLTARISALETAAKTESTSPATGDNFRTVELQVDDWRLGHFWNTFQQLVIMALFPSHERGLVAGEFPMVFSILSAALEDSNIQGSVFHNLQRGTIMRMQAIWASYCNLNAHHVKAIKDIRGCYTDAQWSDVMIAVQTKPFGVDINSEQYYDKLFSRSRYAISHSEAKIVLESMVTMVRHLLSNGFHPELL